MLDELFFKTRADRRKVNYLLYGFILTIAGFFTAVLIFPTNSSIAHILITTILLMPAVVRLFREEEVKVRKFGTKDILKNHKSVFEIFLMLFAGIFLAYLLIQLVAVHHTAFFSSAFSYQANMVDSTEEVIFGFTDGLLQGDAQYAPVLKLFVMFLMLLALTFTLSIFYGGGGIFLMVSTASIYSTLAVFSLTSAGGEFIVPFLLFVLLFALISVPLVLSAMSGGILSRAVVHEKIRSNHFRNVVKDSLFVFGISVALLAAFLLVWIAVLTAFAS